MNEQAFRPFAAARPALSLSALAVEMGAGRSNFLKIIAGLRKVPRAKRGRFLWAA